MIGIRELRGDLAAHIRRAAAGETTVVSVGGRPAAVLAPLAQAPGPPNTGEMRDERTGPTHRSSLEASGAVLPPRRTDGKLPTGTVPTWGSVRLDRLLAEIRG
jgi:prevent-host-death family protein